jgi:polysaccharide deacetylase 2 family uncharacterized protein YibQ
VNGLERRRRASRTRGLWILGSVALALFIMAGLLYLVQWSSLKAENAHTRENPGGALDLSPGDLGIDWVEFWEAAGFIVASRDVSVTEHVERVGERVLTWEHSFEEWLLVPSEAGLSVGGVLAQLVADLPPGGGRLLLERDGEGYVLGLLLKAPGAEQYIPGHTWRFVEANPMLMRARHEAPALAMEGSLPPLLAVVVDDWGYDSTAARQLINYPLPLTVAILPYLPASTQLAVSAAEKGHDVILHQPMEPLDGTLDPGPGAIYLDMDGEEIAAQLMANLHHLPWVVGINNHMGSRATSDEQVMEHVFSILQDTGLFFLDSYTINTSIAGQVAQNSGVPYAVNDLFIDNLNEEDYIMEQIRQGLSLAQRRGSAIIIGHVRARTASALWRMLPEIIASGVRLVPVTALLQAP